MCLGVVIDDMIHWNEMEWGIYPYAGERDEAESFQLFFLFVTGLSVWGFINHYNKLRRNDNGIRSQST